MRVCVSCNLTFQGENWTCPHCQQSPQNIDGFLALAPELAADMDHYDPQFHRELAQIETGHFWFEARNRLILHMLRKHFPETQNFLEIGCGTGFVLQELARTFPSIAISGSDLLSAGLGFAAERVPDATLFQMDARKIPFRDEFDVVSAFDVIEHIEDDQVVLKQMYQAVKPGGGLMISVPQHQFLWSVIDELSYHKRRYSRQNLITKVENAGFEVLQVTSFVSLLLPFMWLSRQKTVFNGEDFDLISEFRINPVINRILARFMHLEYLMLARAGFSFPFGGSLLVVAKRPTEME
ncbi:MAG: methyltransferase domain-containing protein [Chloroflexi bacterium]|nr:methyltransferase domain-containing protein [Chloroflexota bacterium]